MRLFIYILIAALLTLLSNTDAKKTFEKITPKVVIVTLFEPERNAWLSKTTFPRNVSIPGGSPLYPFASCDRKGDVCLITTGEGEINAAATMTAFLYNDRFDLRKSYVLVNGIAGINPHAGTVGSVSFARYALQFGLQFGIDPREMPKGWDSGNWNYGTTRPGKYPGMFYGSEIFELNTNLRDKIFDLAKNVSLYDNEAAQNDRKNYTFAPANKPPTILKGDVITSDLYFTGKI